MSTKTDNLVIVESPAKAKTIEKFLGQNFQVTSSYGHIRDLSKKNLGIDVKNGFAPEYIVPDDKKKVVAELKKMAGNSKAVWLASDEDREGEAIAWHLSEVLGLDSKKTKRIVFHEITKEAIQKAVEKPRYIDQNLVYAQQARRILDRLVGFELSPILWKKIKPSLSAGRVQSVAVRLLVEREREVLGFTSTSTYKVSAVFSFKDEQGRDAQFKAQLIDKVSELKDAELFLEKCKASVFTVTDISTKPSKKSPSAPFTTSTLQQEASRKLGFSVGQTMAVAQKLYEAGKITYMRTDSVNLSEQAISIAQAIIKKQFGEKFAFPRQYKTKAKGAQEAHEAIRPTYLDKETVAGTSNEKRLYELIWKRTIASQMSDALLEKTNIRINLSNSSEIFQAYGEVLKFEGFLKVYIESSDDESDENTTDILLPPVKPGQIVTYKNIIATERYSHYPPRYTEASLVRKLEELGIGRPSTYAPIISTIQNRGYVVKEDRPGIDRNFTQVSLIAGKIIPETKTEIAGAEKAKLFPNDIGMIVNDYLVDNFDQILDLNFTAKVEKQFDDIAEGNLEWKQMIENFYGTFHEKVETAASRKEYHLGERELGEDPLTGLSVIARMGPFGPMAQIGNQETLPEGAKPKFASLRKGQLLETITIKEALDLFQLPRTIGQYEENDIIISIGRFGPYARHASSFYSLKKTDDPYTIELERAIEIIIEKREQEKNKVIMQFAEDKELQILNGRWGPYIARGKENFRIPKGTDATKLNYQNCLEIIKKSATKPAKKRKK